MKKIFSVLLTGMMVLSLLTGCTSEEPTSTDTAKTKEVAQETQETDSKAKPSKIVWYAPAPHPYFDEVKMGVEQFVKEQGIEVDMQIGPDWTQASQNEKVEALAAQGMTALSIYPCDASGANGLYEELTARGIHVINFGTDTGKPTTASFAVATDVQQAAYDATEVVIHMMGKKGNILNVLEVLEDPNTTLRKKGVEECVAKYPDVKIIQEVAGIKTLEEGVDKIESALSANAGQVDGIVCTGFNTTVAMVQTLSDYYEKQGKDKKIYTVGIDTDPNVIKAIQDGTLDATIAQNPKGHGYISCMMLKLLGEGYTVKEGQYFINSGSVVVNKDNLTTYESDINKVTQGILNTLGEIYLTK